MRKCSPVPIYDYDLHQATEAQKKKHQETKTPEKMHKKHLQSQYN